jgi:hypothetical protein
MEKIIGQVLHFISLAVAQACHHRARWRGHVSVIEIFEQYRESLAPGRVSAMPVYGKRRYACAYRSLNFNLLKLAARSDGTGSDMLRSCKSSHKAQPVFHRMPGRQSLKSGRSVSEPRRGVRRDQSLRRFHTAMGIADPLALGYFTLSHIFLTRGASLSVPGLGPTEWVSARRRSHLR